MVPASLPDDSFLEYDYCELQEMPDVMLDPPASFSDSSIPQQDIEYLRYYSTYINQITLDTKNTADTLIEAAMQASVDIAALIPLCKTFLVLAHRLVYIADSLSRVLSDQTFIRSITECCNSLSAVSKHLVISVRETSNSHAAAAENNKIVFSLRQALNHVNTFSHIIHGNHQK